MGFETSDTLVNLSSVIGLFALLIITANILLVVRSYAPHDHPIRAYLSDMKGSFFISGFNILIDVTFLYMVICCAISFY